jgi:aspartyl protease family protein
MALSRGSRSLLVDATGWVFAGGMAAAALIFAPELRDFAYQIAGVQRPAGGHGTMLGGAQAMPQKSSTGGSGRQVELRAQRNGHFITDAEVNGRRIEVMVDTGASIIALTYEDAAAIGIEPSPRDFTHQVNTANGTSRVAPVRLDRVMIGDIMVRDVQAVVSERGKLHVTLLGNSFLSRVTYRMANGRLVIEE